MKILLDRAAKPRPESGKWWAWRPVVATKQGVRYLVWLAPVYRHWKAEYHRATWSSRIPRPPQWQGAWIGGWEYTVWWDL